MSWILGCLGMPITFFMYFWNYTFSCWWESCYFTSLTQTYLHTEICKGKKKDSKEVSKKYNQANLCLSLFMDSLCEKTIEKVCTFVSVTKSFPSLDLPSFSPFFLLQSWHLCHTLPGVTTAWRCIVMECKDKGMDSESNVYASNCSSWIVADLRVTP